MHVMPVSIKNTLCKFAIIQYINIIATYIVVASAAIQMVTNATSVAETAGSVEVCAEITGVTGFLERDVTNTAALTEGGSKQKLATLGTKHLSYITQTMAWLELHKVMFLLHSCTLNLSLHLLVIMRLHFQLVLGKVSVLSIALYKLCRQTLLHTVTRAVWYIILSVNGVEFATSGSLTFNFEVGTATQACINITIINDVDLEGDHTFDIILGTNTPALGGGTGGLTLPTSTTITIQDSEGKLT